ncbi:class I SAM-dependent methyltransferase [Oceanimonas smirnovii]|uniref:class I SAM-dependent methyltransferase n=1 Tax=Oceanimonas smirnovii TaxID=264574 RepID=UPI00036C1CF4|nr:class I SAM-dependent methyltransferase [Oceanimonas smirnovii]
MEAIEFNTVRSKSYKEAINNFSGVWKEDLQVMLDYLAPEQGNNIIELGAGSGFFSFEISKLIGQEGTLHIVDPSKEQLEPLIESDLSNIVIHCEAAENMSSDLQMQLDLIWSRGAFHHVSRKVDTMVKLNAMSKMGARCLIFDIFSGSAVAEYFDNFVAEACTTGHEVSFLSKGFARSMCKLSGWGEPHFVEIPLRWHFKEKEHIGVFLNQLLSNKEEYTSDITMGMAERILGVFKTENGWCLNWPMTLMETKKEMHYE